MSAPIFQHRLHVFADDDSTWSWTAGEKQAASAATAFTMFAIARLIHQEGNLQSALT